MAHHFKEHTMETYFAKNLKIKLKETIIGEVHCRIYNDTLKVAIYAPNSIVYYYTQENLSQEIVHGLTSELLAHKVVKWYRSYINRLYFL